MFSINRWLIPNKEVSLLVCPFFDKRGFQDHTLSPIHRFPIFIGFYTFYQKILFLFTFLFIFAKN